MAEKKKKGKEVEKTIDYVFRSTWYAINKMWNEEASKHGTTMSEAFTLLSIDPIKGTPSTALGPKMGMESTSLSRLLNKLEEKKAIYREPNPEDGRGVIVKLTNYGFVKREDVKGKVYTFNHAMRQHISDEHMAVFFHVADVINEQIATKDIFKEDPKD